MGAEHVALVDPMGIAVWVAELTGIADSLGGDNDGWEAAVKTHYQ